MLDIVLIRHAQTYEKTKRLVDSKLNPELSSLGVQESLKLQEKLNGKEFDKIYVSPMIRAKQTAEILFPNGKQFHEVQGLTEVDLGWLSGKAYNPLTFVLVFINYYWSRPFGSESRASFYPKVIATFKEILQECRKENLERVAIVTHNGVMLTILWHYLRLISFRFSVQYVQPYTLRVTGDDFDSLQYELVS